MTVSFRLEGVTSTGKSDVELVLKDDGVGILSYAENLHTYRAATVQLVNDTGSTSLAVDASISGTPDVAYLDEPTANWTNSAVGGTWDFASVAIAPQGGTESIDATATVDGNSFQIEKSSTVDLSSFAAISGYVYLTSWNSSRHEIGVELRLAGVTQGSEINIASFVDEGLLNVWQQFIVPLGDLGASSATIDQFLFTTRSSSGQPPNYYLDTINIEEVGTDIFKFAPPPGLIFDIESVSIAMRDNITVLEPNQIMGVSALTNGLRIRTVSSGVTRFSGGISTIYDLESFGGIKASETIGATEMMATFVAAGGSRSRLIGDDGDEYSWVVSDNLSAITEMKVTVKGRIQDARV